jgi:hypothetical protein
MRQFAIVTDTYELDQICDTEQEARKEMRDLAHMGLDVVIYAGTPEAIDLAELAVMDGASWRTAARRMGLVRTASAKAKD